MAIYRKAAKRDTAEPAIVAALEAVGASVQRVSGTNAADLIVGYRGHDMQLEVKSGKKKASPGQVEAHANWRGHPIRIVRTVDEALAAIGAFPGPPDEQYTQWVVGPERHPMVDHPNVADAVEKAHKMSHQKFTKDESGAYQLEMLPDMHGPKPTASMSEDEIMRLTVEFGKTMNLLGVGTGFWLDKDKEDDK